MLGYTILLFLLAVTASIFGFGGMAGPVAAVVQWLAIVFIAMFIASLIYGMLLQGKSPRSSI